MPGHTRRRFAGTSIEQDGSFRLNYDAPQGQVHPESRRGGLDKEKTSDDGVDASIAYMMRGKALKTYGTAEVPVTLKNDSTGLVLQVPDVSSTPAPGAAAARTTPAQCTVTGIPGKVD